MSISYRDVERLQSLYPNHQIELKEGRIIIMSPSDGVSGDIGARLGASLGKWVDEHNLGHVLNASAGFHLPNGDVLAPNISFVSRERLKRVPRTYLRVIPEFIAEIKSSTDRISEIQEKIQRFLSQGVQVGILIDPDRYTVAIYHRDKHADTGESLPLATTLKDGDTLTIPELFPGWEIPMSAIWPRVFE